MKIVTELRRRPIGDLSLLSKEDIHPLLKRLYVQRGICSIDDVKYSTHSLLNYQGLIGIEKAVDLLVNSIMKEHKLVIVGDFDADGAISTAITILSLKRMGMKKIEFLIPNRFSEGYGLSPQVVHKAIKNGAQIIMTVDNGISSYNGVLIARENGIPVLITDHHIPGEYIPNADVIVNPNLCSYSFPLKSLSGSGVAFYLMLALRNRLKKNNWFIKNGITVPKLAELLDLVAMGTIIDAVPLDLNNRILVYQGLNRIRSGRCRQGIRALAEVANCDLTKICTNDLSFALGPRLNAAGRLGDMSVGVMLLLEDNLQSARILAENLNILNKTRKKIAKKMESEALVLYQKINSKKVLSFGLVMYHPEWHQGITGILASRIKERFYRPVVIFAPDKNTGVLKGSGRSVTGLHMCDLLKKINVIHPGLILQFGGHAMAVGLTLIKERLEKFCQYFSYFTNEWFRSSEFENIIWSDGELHNKDLSLTIAELIRYNGPWGQNFPYPLFDGKFLILYQKITKNKYLKMLLRPLIGGPVLYGVAFNIDPYLWPNKNIRAIKIAYNLEIRESYGNRDLQLLIQHIWPL